MAFIIAEVGSNWWHPDKEHAKAEIKRAINEVAWAGADAVKFQIFTADLLYSKERAPSLWESASRFEYPLDLLGATKSMANSAGIEFWASVFSPSLIDDVAPYLDGIKVASGDITYVPLLKRAAQLSRDRKISISLSTGASTIVEILDAMNVIDRENPHLFYVFHCVSAYPAPVDTLDLESGIGFKHMMGVNGLGLSDHSLGYKASCYARAMGYTIFEKHFHPWGAEENLPDRSVSLGPDEFKEYVDAIREVEAILGTGSNNISRYEVNERRYARRGSDGLRPIDGVYIE